MVATKGDPADPVELTSFYEKENLPSRLSIGRESTVLLTADLYLKPSRAVHSVYSPVSRQQERPHHPHHATTPLANSRKQLQPPPTRRHDPSHQTPSSTDFERPWCAKKFSCKADCVAISNRADHVLLVRLRSGYTPMLKAYAHLLDPAVNPSCLVRHKQ